MTRVKSLTRKKSIISIGSKEPKINPAKVAKALGAVPPEQFLFQLPIGDWSKDGHRECEWFTVKSNLPITDVFDAYFIAKENLPEEIDPANMCSIYEDDAINSETWYLLDKHGCIAVGSDTENGGVSFENKEFAEIVLWFIQQGNPKLKLEIVPEYLIPKFISWQEHKKRKLGNF